MEMQEAIKIVRALAAGSDPETGEAFGKESVCRKPIVVKALNRALAALVKLEDWDRNKPANAGRAWKREEIVQVCKEVQDGIDFHEIARLHHRTVGSIVARLVKLGKIKPPAARAA
jgi:hypothetical protein